MSSRSSSLDSDSHNRHSKRRKWSHSPEEKHRHKSKKKHKHHEDRHHRRDKDHNRKYRDDGHYRDHREDAGHYKPVRVKREREDRAPDRHRVKHELVSDEEEDQRRQRQRNDRRREENRNQRRAGNPFQDQSGNEGHYGERGQDSEGKNNTLEKDKPNFELSGKLAEDTNTYRGVVIKYSEPPEARKPKRKWRLYPFKGDQALPLLHIHRQSAYLLGRDRKVADIPIDHPSCSKQHAALQYRMVSFDREDGRIGKRVNLYIIDLDSANGTHVNNERIDSRKYVQLLEKDVIKFGFSSREYVLLHDNSQIENDDGTDGENE